MMLLIQIWQQRRVSKLVLIQKGVLMKLAMIKEEQSSMVYEDSVYLQTQGAQLVEAKGRVTRKRMQAIYIWKEITLKKIFIKI